VGRNGLASLRRDERPPLDLQLVLDPDSPAIVASRLVLERASRSSALAHAAIQDDLDIVTGCPYGFLVQVGALGSDDEERLHW
jgi:hypothetical protein